MMGNNKRRLYHFGLKHLKVIPMINDELRTQSNDRFSDMKNVAEAGFQLRELQDDDIEKLLKSMKGKKSLGMDWICGFSLKIASHELKTELKTLINLSMKKHKFVDKWKKTKVLPGWKNKGTRFELKYYRPISNLSEKEQSTIRCMNISVLMVLFILITMDSSKAVPQPLPCSISMTFGSIILIRESFVQLSFWISVRVLMLLIMKFSLRK